MKCTNEAETFSWHSTKILIMELIRNDELTELLMNSPLGLCSSNANLMFSNRHNPPSQREFRWSSYKLREDRKSAQLKWGYEEYEIKKEGPKKTRKCQNYGRSPQIGKIVLWWRLHAIFGNLIIFNADVNSPISDAILRSVLFHQEEEEIRYKIPHPKLGDDAINLLLKCTLHFPRFSILCNYR